jgi:hypothetical protein
MTRTSTRPLIVAWNLARFAQRIATALVLVIILSNSFPRATTAYTTKRSYDGQSFKANSRDFQNDSTPSGTIAAGPWYMFSSPDGDFRLAFPSRPTAEEATQGPTTLIRTFGLVTANGMRFSINFHDMGGDPLAPESNEWGRNMEQMASEADRKDGLRVVQTQRVGKNIVETELWQAVPDTGAKINYLRRSILRRARVYTLACGSVINGKQVDKSIYRRFFNSFRFRKPSR